VVRVAPLADEARGLQDTEMARDRWPADRKARRDLARRELAAAQVLKDLTAGGIGERLEDAGLLLGIELAFHMPIYLAH
jgi:hypothetical protein